MTIKFKHGFGDIVFLKTDIDQIPRMVVQVAASPKENVQYQLASGDRVSWHHEMEVTEQKDILITSTN